jgi:hypothetical protein
MWQRIPVAEVMEQDLTSRQPRAVKQKMLFQAQSAAALDP